MDRFVNGRTPHIIYRIFQSFQVMDKLHAVSMFILMTMVILDSIPVVGVDNFCLASAFAQASWLTDEARLHRIQRLYRRVYIRGMPSIL